MPVHNVETSDVSRDVTIAQTIGGLSPHKSFLLGCFEVPGYGGASTVAYRLFQDLQAQGLDISFVNIIGQDDAEYLRAAYGETVGNPNRLENVHNVVLDRAPYYPSPSHPVLEQLIRELAPDVLVGVGYIATLLLKASALDKRIVFITTGCDHAKQEITAGRVRGVSEILERIQKQNASSKFFLRPLVGNNREAQAVAGADLILVHSEMTRTLFEYYFRSHSDKIFPETLWLADWICQDATQYLEFRKGFSEREIDVLFIASGWNRPEKNWALAREIILRHPDLKIHVVGNIQQPVGEATYHGLVADRAALFALLGNTRVLVSPSCFDTAPGVLFEAVVMGCNVVASQNCGNWELCNPALLADPYRAEAYSQRIRMARAREYRHNLGRFLHPSARQTLMEILDVF